MKDKKTQKQTDQKNKINIAKSKNDSNEEIEDNKSQDLPDNTDIKNYDEITEQNIQIKIKEYETKLNNIKRNDKVFSTIFWVLIIVIVSVAFFMKYRSTSRYTE